MKPHIVAGVKNLMSARAPELKELTISWFGGEPLLALPVVEDIAAHAFRLASEYDFRLRGGFTTNAYLLTPGLLRRLVGYQQTFYQITLDGWRDAHDKTRVRADGKGTFETIWKNLLLARDTDLDFDIQLRIHVTNENHDSLRILCKEIFENMGGDHRFRIDIQDVRNLGGDNGKAIATVPVRSFKQITRELISIFESGSYIEPDISTEEPVEDEARPLGESAGSRLDYAKSAAPYICYASKPNHLLIRASGGVGKCTVALNDERNDLGHLNPDGTISIDQEKARRWSKGFETFDLLDLACPIANMRKQPSEEKKKEIPLALELA